MQCLRQHKSQVRPGTARARVTSAAGRKMAVPVHATYKVYVKGDPKTDTMGDCPFSQRVLLTLETKSIPYEREYIDFAAKPDWLVKMGGKVPVLQDGDSFLPDSGEITKMLEEKFPEPSMKSSLPPDFAAGFFPAFRAFLLAGGSPEEKQAKRAALEAELKVLNDELAKHPGQLFGGSRMNSTDAFLTPRLNHTIIALRHFKNWSLPPEFSAIKSYMARVHSLPAWIITAPSEDVMIQNWTKVILNS